MDRQSLINRLSQDIFVYLLEGQLSEDDVATLIRPENLDERFDEYERLANLHFVMRDRVEEFIEELDNRLRSIRTSTKRRSHVSRGEINGSIDWPGTYRYRHSKEPRNRSVYLAESREEQHAIPENVVLLGLLNIISEALDDASEFLEDDRSWVTQRWSGDPAAVDEFQHLIESNIHLRQIRDLRPGEPTERMVTTAKNARQPLYQEAAELITFHEALQRGTPEAMQTLLGETMITPEDVDTLLELVVLFQVIKSIENLPEYGPAAINSLTTERKAVAEIPGPVNLLVYYNQSGRDQDMSFLPIPESDDLVEASRGDAVQILAKQIADEYFVSKTFRDHSNRPDVLVIPKEPFETAEWPYFVVEVKNSVNSDIIRNGIRELLEYLAFMRRDEDLIFPSETKFGTSKNGLLVVQDFQDEDIEVQDSQNQQTNPITILQATEIESQIDTLVSQVFETHSSCTTSSGINSS